MPVPDQITLQWTLIAAGVQQIDAAGPPAPGETQSTFAS
jgi:hypothetical protein